MSNTLRDTTCCKSNGISEEKLVHDKTSKKCSGKEKTIKSKQQRMKEKSALGKQMEGDCDSLLPVKKNTIKEERKKAESLKAGQKH